ncbi:thiolase family protein [Loigolactobacillus jiayinensis]|uniref:Thiolase family protein n=1 Tax=Loigolactobacillus jiayinensis TaxID=2486016 RepID=A0ABW1RIA8_9LACO|nr:thiolase family protein [Loigolactobacillus jiayinensis]
MKQQFTRPVSVVGTSTLGQRYFDDPEYEGLSIYELWACACHQAMDDAGVKPKDIDKIVYSQFANFVTAGNAMAMVGSLEEWAGVAGKPITHIEQACASGYIAFTEACNAVASGKADIVLCAGVETPKHFNARNQPAYMIQPISKYDGWWSPGRVLFDTTYYRFDGVSDNLLTEEQGKYYQKHYGISEETLDETYNAMAVNLRRNASRNPRACERKEYTEIAKENGYDDVMDYMRSDHNPKITQYIRKSGSVLHNVAAGAIIVCSEEMAKKLNKKAVTVIDHASSSNTQRHPYCFHQMNVDVRDALYKNQPDLKGDDLDLMVTTVMTSGEQLDSAEVFGYLPEGKGYQYELDGRTCFDGDTPINPHGGDLSFGHAFGAAGINMISEAILQMRGEAGGCQVPKPVNTCLVRGMGGGHTTVGILLENQQ